MSDLETVDRLISEKKVEEATALITKLIDACKTPQEVEQLQAEFERRKGKRLFDGAAQYFRESNQILRDYEQALDRRIAVLREIRAREDERNRLNEARNQWRSAHRLKRRILFSLASLLTAFYVPFNARDAVLRRLAKLFGYPGGWGQLK
jgi:hypothetical protein